MRDGIVTKFQQQTGAFRLRATEIVLAHNHFAEARPSAADLAVTRRLVAAGALVGVPLRAPGQTFSRSPARWAPSTRAAIF